jgi:eukaryotic-like serine/threonine-protein kinase
MSMSQVGSGLPRLLAERYELVEQVAAGSMTSVWRGHDRVLGRDVVVKVLHPDLAADARVRGSFHDEAVRAARLTHPNIVALYDTGEQQGVNYIVMELVQGLTLRDVVSSHGPLPPARAARLASEIVNAVDYAHQSGVVHHNLKPTNILLGDDGTVKVADFSIARAANEDGDSGRTGELLAVGGYLAPELVDGAPADARADVFGVGACLFEMLTGRQPSAGGASRDGAGPLSPRAIRAGVPRELDAVVLKAMSPEPRDRYPTAAAMGAALARSAAEDSRREPLPMPLLDQTPPPMPMGFETERQPSFIRHEGRWLGWTLVVVGLVAALVVVGISLDRTGVLTLPGTHDSPPRSTPKPTAPAPAALQIQGAQAYDPFGSPNSENDADAPKAADGDPATSWNTEHYNSPEFGRLKPGVGLVLDAGSPQEVSRIDLRLLAPGASIEVYGSDSVPTSLDQWGTRLASRPGAPNRFSVDLPEGTDYRYYLVWFTKLPPAPDGHQFQDGIAEATLRS